MTIVLAESVRASALEIRFEAEKIGVEIRMQSTPRCSALKPGRMMIMAPMKPTKTAIQRRIRTSSRRNNAAPMVTKIGPVKPSAVISARVVSGSAMNHRNMPTVWMAPREMCRPRRLAVQRTMEAQPEHDRQQEHRTEEIAQERHHVRIEMLCGISVKTLRRANRMPDSPTQRMPRRLGGSASQRSTRAVTS